MLSEAGMEAFGKQPRGRGPIRWALLALGFAWGLGSGCTRHPTEVRQGDDVAQGWESFRMGEYGVAARSFERALATFAEDAPARPMACYGLAVTCALRMPAGDQDKPRARALYRQVMEQAPQSDVAPWCALALARMEHLVEVGEEPDIVRVRAAYEDVIRRYAEHPAAEEALLYLQSTHISEMSPASATRAATALETFVREHPRSGYTSAAFGLLDSCYNILEQPEQRVRCLVKALDTREIDPSNPLFEKSWIYWRIACVAEFEAGDFATARKYYRLLLDEYPMDIRGFSAETALKRMDAVEASGRASTGPHARGKDGV
jgi:tetratricopeptide (TPR) repeat protein